MNHFGVKQFFVWITCCLLLVSMAACSSNQAKPAASPAQPAPSASVKPDQQKPPADAEWTKIVEAAKKEGEVIVFGQPSVDREDVIKLFAKEFPEIKVKYTGMRPNQSAPKILEEQKQEKYLVDLYLEIPPDFLPKSAFGPIRDFIVRQEMKDDKTWVGGYQKGYEITSNAEVYPFAVQTIPSIHVNNDVIPVGEIKSYDDLLNPKWKGKIMVGSFDKTAQGSGAVNALLMLKGEAFLKKLVEGQETQIKIFDNRQILENFATGKYPIVIGPTPLQVKEFVDTGVVKKATKLEEIVAGKIDTVINPANLSVLKNPPHPNASKVFINWFLGKDAQTAWVTKTDGFISRRMDVKNPDPNVTGWDNINAKFSNHSEESRKSHDWVIEYGKKLLSSK